MERTKWSTSFSSWLVVIGWLPVSMVFFACDSAQVPAATTLVDGIFAPFDKEDSPGCAVLVIRDGKVVYEKGYGMADLEHGIPIGPDTVFYVGSVSKQFVAMSLLLLEEEGRLSLDDNIRTYLPDFPDYGDAITLKHLVYHTSGIRDYLELWLLSGRDYLDDIPVRAAYEMIIRQEQLNFRPGERHLYSNSCYFLIPLIVERVTGQSFKTFSEEQIFGPLGMSNSHFHDDNGHIIPGRAFGYEEEMQGFRALPMRFDLVGSGGLYSTVRDLAKWDANFYLNRLGKGDPELIEKAHVSGVLNSGEKLSYAFALENGSYRGLRTVSHGGALGGYRAQFLRFPEQKFSVIILANLAGIDTADLAYKVADTYLSGLYSTEAPVGESPAEEKGNEPEFNSGPDLTPYEGVYYNRELETRHFVEERGGELSLRIGWNPEVSLKPTDRDIFRTSWFELRFERGSSDNVLGFELESGRVKGLKFRRE